MTPPIRGIEHANGHSHPPQRVRESFGYWPWLDSFSTPPDWTGDGWLTRGAGGFGWGGVRGQPTRDRDPDPKPGGLLTEIEWQQMLLWSRDLCDRNPQAIGFLGHISNFVGDMEVRFALKGQNPGAIPLGDNAIDPDVAAVQDAWEDWTILAGWDWRQPECRMRAFRDGESLLRFFRGDPGTDGLPSCRIIEPEQVQTPRGGSQSDEWGWGIHCEDGDPEQEDAYWIADPTTRGLEGDRVPADRIARLKLNTDRTVKRGLSDFFAVQDMLRTVQGLLTNMGTTTKSLSNYLWVTEHAPGVTLGAAQSLIDAGKTYDSPVLIPPSFGGGGGGVDALPIKRLYPGTIEHTSNGQKIGSVPVTNSDKFIAVEQAILRAVGTRWGAAEYFSGDSSNANFSSSLVAGGPFVRAVEARQLLVASWARRVVQIVLHLCVESGRLTREQVRRVKPDVVPSAVVIVDQLAQAQRFQILHDLGLDEPTILQECGYKPKQVAANKKAWTKLFPEDSGGDLLGPGAGLPPGGEGGEGGGLMRGLLGESALPSLAGLVYLEEAEKKVPFTGRITDALGRARCYQAGKPVPCHTVDDADAVALARANARRILQDPASATPEDVRDLLKTMQGLTAVELKQLQREFTGRHKARIKAERVNALVAHARAQVEAVTSAPPEPPTTPSPAPTAAAPVDLADKASVQAALKETGNKLPSWNGRPLDPESPSDIHKVLIADLYDAMQDRLPPGTTLDQFKATLAKDHQEALARTDLVQAAHSHEQLQRSATADAVGREDRYHVVDVSLLPDAPPLPARPAPARADPVDVGRRANTAVQAVLAAVGKGRTDTAAVNVAHQELVALPTADLKRALVEVGADAAHVEKMTRKQLERSAQEWTVGRVGQRIRAEQ